MHNEQHPGKFDALDRVADFEERAAGLSLRAYEWELALALDGKMPAVTVGKRLGFDAEVVKAAIASLSAKNLVVAKTVTLEDFKRDRAAEPTKAAEAAEPPQLVAAASQPQTVAPAPRPAAPAMPNRPPAPPPKLAFSLKPSSPSLPVSRPPAWSGGSTPVTPPPPVSEAPPLPAAQVQPGADGQSRFRMKPLVDFIIQQAGGNSLPKLAAQLAVYRVFRRVPRDLILANNIRTLNITDESFEVQSRELYDAIVDAIESTFGVKYARN